MESELRAYHRLYAERFVLRERRPARRRAATSSSTRELEDPAEVWFDETAVKIHQAEVAKTLGRPEGVLALARYALPPTYPGLADTLQTAAEHSPGPAAIVLVYASSAGATLLDRRLYLPETWFRAERPTPDVAWAVPAWVTYQTSLTLGAEMIQAALASSQVPACGVLLDQVYSQEWRFLDELHQAGRTFSVETNRAYALWRRAPAGGANWEADRVDLAAARQSREAWRRLGVDEFLTLRIVLDRRGQPGPEGWLIVRRPAGVLAVDRWRFFISNAPADTLPSQLAQLVEWPAAVDEVLEDCRVEAAAEAAPGWAGWHHFTTLTMVAHYFLVQLRRRFGAAAPALTVPQTRRLLEAVLLRPEFDVWPAVAEIERIQHQNLAAYCPSRFSIGTSAPAAFEFEALSEPCPAI